ncbi:hypothetical protein HMPREF9189_1503 [Streptococcus sp. oral taxon 071 str. 73H25AP]|nr:hypothetical protein HMPREF9189_1503 [Streptococcus sp. oral taxon 071 str. 73H25AP]
MDFLLDVVKHLFYSTYLKGQYVAVSDFQLPLVIRQEKNGCNLPHFKT